ncbi:MAG: FAD binding domain-containing protein [Actinomycetota bacterium]
MSMHQVQDRTWAVDRYERPATLDEALRILATYGERARIVAGATDLLLEMQRNVRQVDVLVDLSAISGLDEITNHDGTIELGPLVTHRQVVTSDIVASGGLPLAQASLEVGSAQLRNRATVAGNLITASPANDTISALVALGATVTLTSATGSRVVSLDEFYTGVRTTIMSPHEIMTSITFKELTAEWAGMFAKVGLRSAQAISVVHAAIVLERDDSTVTAARIALGSVAPTIVLADAAELLIGSELTEDVITRCAGAAAAEVRPIDDVRATAAYRTEMLEVAVERMLRSLSAGTEAATWPGRTMTLSHGDAPSASVVSVSGSDDIEVTVNGVATRGADGTSVTLLDWIRTNARDTTDALLTGTKEGCAEGECGACTVHMDGQAVLACMVPAAAAHGSAVTTVEGLTSDVDRALEESLVSCGAVQCGYCTPGFVMSASSLIAEHEDLTDAEIRDGLGGNICRCTGYTSIVEALDIAGRVTS